MDDLTATRLCAEAMGLKEESMLLAAFATDTTVGWKPKYDPLHDDAQAMQLVRKFRLIVEPTTKVWLVACDSLAEEAQADPDLNRAIVYAVAKMQEAKR